MVLLALHHLQYHSSLTSKKNNVGMIGSRKVDNSMMLGPNVSDEVK